MVELLQKGSLRIASSPTSFCACTTFLATTFQTSPLRWTFPSCSGDSKPMFVGQIPCTPSMLEKQPRLCNLRSKRICVGQPVQLTHDCIKAVPHNLADGVPRPGSKYTTIWESVPKSAIQRHLVPIDLVHIASISYPSLSEPRMVCKTMLR